MESSTPPRDTAWAMSEENVEMVRRYFEAYDRGDIDGWKSLLAPEVEFRPLAADLMGGSRRGVEDVARTIIEFLGPLPRTACRRRLSMTRAIRWWSSFIAALGALEVLRRSKIALRSRPPDGRIIRMRSFPRLHEALEAAGLRK